MNREEAVKLIQAFVAKDQLDKDELYILFSGDKKILVKLDQAFEVAEKNWHRHLKSIFGPGEVERLFSLFMRDITKIGEKQGRVLDSEDTDPQNG